MSERVVGLDLSLTATGIAKWSTLIPGPQLETLGDEGLRGLRRLQSLRTSITARVRGADLVVVEALQPAGHTRAAAYANERAGLHWLLLDRLHYLSLRYVEVPSACVKGYATGTGGGRNATKAAVIANVVSRYGAMPHDDNQADACVLAAMGLHWLGYPPAPVPELHRKWLDKVRWPA